MNTPQANKARVAIGRAVAKNGIGKKCKAGRDGQFWVTAWPCARDHHPENIYSRGDGKELRCRACESIARRKNREANKERERRLTRERRRRAKVAAGFGL